MVIEMQTGKRQFSRHMSSLFFGFVVFIMVGSTTASVITHQNYRKNITSQIQNMMSVLSQSVDNFFHEPEQHLIKVRDHIEEYHATPEVEDENCFILDVVHLIDGFDSFYLLDENGIVLNTWPYDPDIKNIDLSNQNFFSRASRHGDVHWSNSFINIRNGYPTIALSIQSNLGLVAAYYNLQELSDFVSVDFSNPDSFVAILERNGSIVAHNNSRIAIQSENLRNLDSVKRAINGEFGLFIEPYNGSKWLISIQEAAHSGFLITVFRPYDAIYGQIRTLEYVHLSSLIFALVLLSAIMYRYMNRAFKNLHDLMNAIQLASDGYYQEAASSQYVEFELLSKNFGNMVQKVAEREEQLKQSIGEKDTLLRELYHRTKNNMQVILGLMKLYANDHHTYSTQEILDRIASKIYAIALVHQKLYQSADLSNIRLQEYIEELSDILIRTFAPGSPHISHTVNCGEIRLLIDYAVPCGIILNELITNSMKYAFDFTPDSDAGEQPEIRIDAQITQNANILIRYSDNGRGLNKTEAKAGENTLGLELVKSIAEFQLNGNFTIEDGPGYRCSIRFPITAYSSRI